MNSYDYPEGADNSSAPWNEKDLPEIELPIKIDCCLTKTVNSLTSDYVLDGDGDVDTSDTNLKDAYFSSHYSIEDLLVHCRHAIKEYIDTLKEDSKNKIKIKQLEYLLDECKGWEEVEREFSERE